MSAEQPSRTVTLRTKCATCGGKFTPRRADARYCGGACRQRVARARAKLSEIDREIEKARLRYWTLVREKAVALGVEPSHIVTAEAPTVDVDGSVYLHGEHVGHVEPHRPGWAAWGLEAAGPPWTPPPA